MAENDYTAGARGGVAVVTDGDRVRWGPILAGLFAAMATLAVLGVLGVAVGLSAVDANDRAGNYGIGAGIWGGVSTLIAFFIGGYLASRSSGGRGSTHGVLNGTMVWVVAIPLMVYMLAGGIGSLFGAAGNVAATGTQAISSVGGTYEKQMREEDIKATTQNVTEDVKAKAEEIKNKITPQNVEATAHKAAAGAWGTLVAMLLGLAAAALGGYVDSRNRGTRIVT